MFRAWQDRSGLVGNGWERQSNGMAATAAAAVERRDAEWQERITKGEDWRRNAGKGRSE